MIILAVVVAASLAVGASADVEHIGQPCRARNVLAGRTVTDRASGREWFVLTNMNEDTGCELIFIDYMAGEGKAIRAPAGSGSWALDEVPGDRLIVGTFYDGQFMVFDLRKMEFIKTAAFPGESYIWDLAMGSDGRIYGGTYGGGKLGALDLNTYEVEDCGAPAPPNMYLRYLTSTPDGRIICNFGFEKPTTLIYYTTKKSFEPVPKHLQGAGVGVSWNGYYIYGSTVCDGKTLEKVDPPFPTPSADKGAWMVDAYASTPEVLVIKQGNSIFTFKTGDKELTFIADINLRGGRILAVSRDGAILGVRGQDYFIIDPGDKDLQLHRIPAESGPRPTMFLEVDDKGRIWGGPHFGQTLFWMDPATKKTVNTSNICDAGGEVYDVAFHNGKVYAAAYAGGDIVEYDPEAPWDQWGGANPKVFADVGDRGYIRPVAGICEGPDGKLYSGWMAKYGVYGGAVAITDPATGDTRLIENPLGEQAVSGLAVDEKFIYIGTSLGANGLPNKTGEAVKLGIIDRAAGKVIFEMPFEGASHVSKFALDSSVKRLAFAVDGRLRMFDTSSRKLLDDVSKNAPPVSSTTIRSLGDGSIIYSSDRSIVKMDLVNGKIETVAELPAKISCLVPGSGGVIYVSCGVDIYAVRK